MPPSMNVIRIIQLPSTPELIKIDEAPQDEHPCSYDAPEEEYSICEDADIRS
jgi:hypothetical protein